MNLQKRRFSFDIRGEDVVLLHSELLQLGFDIPIYELQEPFFELDTREATMRFQTAYLLESAGMVDGPPHCSTLGLRRSGRW